MKVVFVCSECGKESEVDVSLYGRLKANSGELFSSSVVAKCEYCLSEYVISIDALVSVRDFESAMYDAHDLYEDYVSEIGGVL